VDDRQLRRLGLGGIAILVAAGALYFMWPESPEPRRPARFEASPASPAAPAPAGGPPAPEPVRAPTLQSPRADEPRSPDLPADPRARLKALEPLRREVFAGLADLAGRVEACSLSDPNLFLTLETLDGRVRVLEVRVMPAGAGTGGITDAEPVPRDDHPARCVRGALERTIISAPSAKPGRQWEMAWSPGASP